MCGLAALYAYRSGAPPVARADLRAAEGAMRHRGPDGAGLWLGPDGRIGLAHRRLAIIDLSGAALQPMALEDGRFRIVYNGEIYNYRELRAELEAQGERFRTGSDTEVVLRLYRRMGARIVERLRGMYALALWDSAERTLFLARDPFGIKPLYYADDGASVRVASTVKALLAAGGADTRPDAAGHAGFLVFGSVPEPHTLFRGIRALPAGSAVTFGPEGPSPLTRHFEPRAVIAAAPPAQGAAPLGDALRASVAAHMVADVPVGVFLSAGRDSTSIAALAAEIKGASLDTLTLGFKEYRGSDNDETPLAEAVARSLGTRQRTEWVEGHAFHDARAALFAAMDQPSVDGVNTYFVASVAKAAGLKVALSGLGGDELFGGYDTFRDVPRLSGVLGAVPGLAVFGRCVRIVAGPAIARLSSPKWAGLLELGTRAGDAYLLRRGLFMPWELPLAMDPEMARDGWRALDGQARLASDCAGIAEPWRRVQALEIAWYMRHQLLRDADWAGMAHGIEIRTPLVDATLFRALAPWLGRPGGPDKIDMARVPRTPLPPEVLARPKTGFRIPILDWLAGPEDAAALAALPTAARHGYRGWALTVLKEVYAEAPLRRAA